LGTSKNPIFYLLNQKNISFPDFIVKLEISNSLLEVLNSL